MTRQIFTITILLCGLLFSCGPKKTSTDNSILKVYVDSKGQILANDETITLTDLDKKMGDLEKIKGTVYYSRDDAQNDPPKESMQVMDLIVKHQLAVKFFQDKGFSVPVSFK
jgi:biopolymer transport protein ExbD